MRSTLLLSSLALTTALTTHAFDTTQHSEAILQQLGNVLADTASASQWQQLWQRTRAAGHFANGDGAHFTLSQQQIPSLVKSTLDTADSVAPEPATLAVYRKDFHPQVVGQQGQAALSAICLRVDWRNLPPSLPANPQAHMSQVSLLRTWPC